VLLIACISAGCGQNDPDNHFSFVNTTHLDHLYEEVVLDEKPMAIIHIYANYPDYVWADVPEEGTACVDDVARAVIFYLFHFEVSGDSTSLKKAKKLLNFLCYMQAENGLFNNFIYADLSVNTTRENSLAKPDWWTWRAIWAMAESLTFFKETDPGLTLTLKSSIERTFSFIDLILSSYPHIQKLNGLNLPRWLPYENAADQASVLQLALLAYYRHYPEPAVQAKIMKINAGLMAMQMMEDKSAARGVFLSWKNTWHDWGNCQAIALLGSGQIFGDQNFIKAGLMEVDFFHPYLLKHGYLCRFELRVEDTDVILMNEKKFPQIAYGIRPLVWANLSAYQLTKNEKYIHQAAEIACWFFGKNDSGKLIYNPDTGRCFDGIDDAGKINKNAGAESTIEALLTLVLAEKNVLCASIMQKYYRSHLNH
jgi:hypothetical protein